MNKPAFLFEYHWLYTFGLKVTNSSKLQAFVFHNAYRSTLVNILSGRGGWRPITSFSDFFFRKTASRGLGGHSSLTGVFPVFFAIVTKGIKGFTWFTMFITLRVFLANISSYPDMVITLRRSSRARVYPTTRSGCGFKALLGMQVGCKLPLCGPRKLKYISVKDTRHIAGSSRFSATILSLWKVACITFLPPRRCTRMNFPLGPVSIFRSSTCSLLTSSHLGGDWV